MKKIIIILISVLIFTNCKNETKSKKTENQINNLTLLKGQFIYYDGAAVLQSNSEIYGVLITDKMLELNKLAEKYKTEPTDMVQIEIKGKITTQDDDKILWKNKVEIVDIISVNPPSKKENNIVKLGNK